MDYELAKELKDKGFPQSVIGTQVYGQDGKSKIITTVSGELDVNKDVIVPKLEELMQNIPSELIIARRPFDEKYYLRLEYLTDGDWIAYYVHHIYEEEICRHESYGKTPIEAVARLWIALQDNT